MRKVVSIHSVLGLFLILSISPCFSAWAHASSEESKYLQAVREFADNVLKYGRDTYGSKHTPLFIDGLNVHTHEPVKWNDPNTGDHWTLSNLASQQNLFRTLDGLTRITGDPKYKQAAMDAIEYAFENLRGPNGLFYWGVGYAYDADGDRERSDGLTRNHSLRFVYPYYRLMWDVTQDGLKGYIESLWAAHVLDWSNLDVLRYAPLDKYKVAKGWNHKYKGGPVSNVGEGDCVTGSDLYYAAAIFSKLSGEKEPLTWAKRMAYRYVETRDPNTGIAALSYNIPTIDKHSQFADDFEGRNLSFFPYYPKHFSEGDQKVGFWAYAQIRSWICTCLLGDLLGSDGEDFRKWALEELTAWGKSAYREKGNVFIPMLTDGTSLEGYVIKKDGPYGAKGTVFRAWQPHGLEFWAYALAHRISGDQFVWEMARSIAKGNGLGDIGPTVKGRPELERHTDCSDPYTLLGFLELHRKTRKTEFIEMATSIGNNILRYRFYNGFFVPSKRHIYTRFDDIEHLVLLHLFAALDSKSVSIPWVWPGKSGFGWDYRQQKWVFDVTLIYPLTDSPEPPILLHEAAAIGDLTRVKLLLQEGTDVNLRERDMATPLHRAVLRGNKEIVAFLLTKGADIEVRDSWPGGTPLYYAAEKGHEEIMKILIAKGADVNLRVDYPSGDTPLHAATRAGYQEIAELLIAADADINTKDNNKHTPLWHAKSKGNKEIIELLRKHGAKE